MSIREDFARYSDYEKHVENQRAIGRFFRMCNAQDKEITPTMLHFDGGANDPFSIKIVKDSGGWITANIRDRLNGKLLYTVRFEKKHHKGAVWIFRDAVRLSYLAFEPEKITFNGSAS